MGLVTIQKRPSRPSSEKKAEKSLGRGESKSHSSASSKLGHFASGIMKEEQFGIQKKRNVKPSKYKFDRPVPKYMLKEAESNDQKMSPMKALKEDTDTVVITASDISRIKNNSSFMTAADIARLQKEQYEERMRNSAIANQRKAMMLKMEAERKKKVGALTETERLKKEKDALILSKVNRKWEEEIDYVKKMNSMMLYAKTATIRDQQKLQKAEQLVDKKNLNEKLDAIMINKTIKDGEVYDQREVVRAENRRQGAIMLQKQIEDLEAQRRVEEEMKELEAKCIVKEIERLKQEDLVKVQEKHEAGQRLVTEIAQFNKDQIEHKKQLAEMEKEEEERINIYLYMKDLKEQQYQEEQERIKKFKEMEIARLRTLQEKAQDRQAQLDELRAQRVQEALERDWREKERAEVEKLKKMNKELAQAREEQRLFKMKQLADQGKQEKIEFYRVLQEQQGAVKKIKEEEERMLKRNIRNKQEILEQIRENKEKRERGRKEELEFGEKQRLRMKVELQVLEAIKARKLKELEQEGVPEKYRAELARKKITI